MKYCQYCSREDSPVDCAEPVYQDGKKSPYICNRNPGHSGPHVACGGEGLHELAVSSTNSEEDTSRMTNKNIRPFAWHFSVENDSVQIEGDKLTIVADNEVSIPYEFVNDLVDAILEAKRHMDSERFRDS